jgi:hypothetical protein
MRLTYEMGNSLTVRCVGTRTIGRCYAETTYEVRSTRPLPRSVFDGLREAGLVGYGQSFSVSEPKEVVEVVEPVLLADDRVLARGVDAISAINGSAPLAWLRTTYVYSVTDACDSGD